MHYLYYNSTKELHSWGVPCALGWRNFQQNRPCRKCLAVPRRIFCLPPAQHTAACSWRDHFYYQWLSLCPQDRYFFFQYSLLRPPVKRLSLCVQYCMSAPFLDTENLDGSHSVAFGEVTPPFGLREDLKCAVPCTGPPELRFDRTSTKLNVLFLLSVLALDTKSTTLLGAETWSLPCSSELPKYAVLC